MAIDALNIADVSIISTQESEKRYGKLEENSIVAIVTLKPGVKDTETIAQGYGKKRKRWSQRFSNTVLPKMSFFKVPMV